MHHLRPTRRQFLQGTAGLVVTFALSPVRERGVQAQQDAEATGPGTVRLPPDQTEQPIQTRDVAGDRVNSWLSIDKNGVVTIYVGKVELGTGIMTALAQIAAEELDVPFAQVIVIQGDTELTPDQGYTAGSMSLQVAGPVIQQAAAEVRLILLERAAARLGVPNDTLQVHDGVIVVASDQSKSVPYGALVDEPFTR